jgi:hypothetical protein
MIQASALIAKFVYALTNLWGYIWGAAGILWTDAKQQQKVNYMRQKYGEVWKTSDAAKGDNYYYSAMYGAKWVGHYVADCSGLFAWAFQLLGGSIAHGSNSIWNSYCTNKGKLKGGKRTDGKKLKPGSAVFTYNAAKKNRGHIGLYIGDGRVIEASGTKAGVVKSSVGLSKWVEWGELKGIDYSGSEDSGEDPAPDKEPDTPEEGGHPTLRRGSKGEDVKELQTLLQLKGYDLGSCGIDGDFGKATEKAGPAHFCPPFLSSFRLSYIILSGFSQ